MKKKMFFIIVSVLLMIVATVYTGINIQKKSEKSFTKSGYILNGTSASENEKDADSNENSIKYYFGEETTYKNTINDNVEFKDTNGKTVKVPEASFIHYEDDSIGLLKKGVILNLEDVGKDVPIYYNLFEGTILQYSSGTYKVDNLGKELKFKEFVVRVSDNKYLLVSNDIKLKLDDNTTTNIKSNYVEISIIEEGIARIENQDATYQTVATDASISIGDISLNLDNGYFFKNEEPIINLNSMIIDSDDNIDITPIQEIKDKIEKEKEEEEKEKNPGGNNNGNGSGGSGDASGGAEGEEGSAAGGFIGSETEVEENTLTLPTASLSDVEVSANAFQGTITINDPDSIITGSTYTSIVENSSGRIVYEKETDAGIYTVDVFAESLLPETSYSLVSNIHYLKNEIEYTMDVVQQLFVTSSIGIGIEKDYYSYSELAFRVKIDDYSKVKSADVKLVSTTGEVLDVQPVTDVTAKVPEGLFLSFSGLNSNTKYSIVVDNILYEDTVVADEYNLEISAKTLKAKPSMGAPSFSIDKKNGLFTLKLENMVDTSNGVEQYIYELYDARTLSDNPQPVVTIEKGNLASIDIPVDGETIQRAVPYAYKVKALFYDNEKYIEYTTGYSNNMQMDGVTAPSVSWEVDEENGGITFERINGFIRITDPAGTIDYNSPMTVMYTNSIGTSISRTYTTGNAIIPFNENNLRANETYTISLYASVNLMDDNPAIDNFHVGSVIVKTEPTKKIDVLYNINSDVTEAFSVNCKLLNVNGADNTLEASTLSELTFLLYDGSSNTGTVVKRIRKVDRDERYYYSTLKEDYYDNTFTITPSFFNLNNADLKSEYYTIQIIDAKDYTDFKNDIPLSNSVVTVQVNGFVEDPKPEDKEWFSNVIIRNKDAGAYGKYDKNLDSQTIVGIKVSANFDNTKRYGVNLNYYVWDYTAGEEGKYEVTSQRQTVTFKADGTIDPVYYWFEKGTPDSTDDQEDGKLHRGHIYKFSFVGGLDLNKDGEVDTRYPVSEGNVLLSGEFKIPKQSPKILMYPSTSDSTSFTIKYTLEDEDYALHGSSLSAVLADEAGTTLGKNTQSVVETTEYKTLKFTDFGNKEGYLSIVADVASYKGLEPAKQTYINQYFTKEYALPTINYSFTDAVNRILISIDNYDSIAQHIAHIAALKLTFTCEGNTIVKDFVKLNGDNAVVDMYELADFMGKPISMRVEAYYDDNTVGWDPKSEYVALQSVRDVYGGGTYFTLNQNNFLVESDIARGSIYSLSLNTESKKYVLSQMGTMSKYSFDMEPQKGGIRSNGQYFNLKNLKLKELNNSGSNDTFTFYQITPGISLENDDGILDISPAIKSVAFKAEVFGFGSTNIKDSKIFVQLSYTDDVGSYLTSAGDPYEFTLDQINSGVCELDNLKPGTNYAMQFFAYVNNGQGGYTYTQLYDLDDNSENRIYFFRTLLSVGISNIKASYYARSYDEKNILLYYDLDRIMGYDKIEYKIYKQTVNPTTLQHEYVPVDIEIEPDVGFKYEMVKHIPCGPGSVFDFGSTYKIEIIPYAQSSLDGEWVALDEKIGEYTYNLRKLRNPYIGVTSSLYNGASTVEGTSLEFKVTFYDVDKVVVDGTYSIELYEILAGNVLGNPISTPYDGKVYKNSSTRRSFIMDGLEENKSYMLRINYLLDSKNKNEPVSKTYDYVAKALSPDAITVGTISAVPNAINKNRIDLNFTNSSKIKEITNLRYSLFNSLDGTSFDNDIKFELTQKTVSGTTVYSITLPDALTSQGVYVLQLQFIAEDQIVEEQIIDYSYFL